MSIFSYLNILKITSCVLCHEQIQTGVLCENCLLDIHTLYNQENAVCPLCANISHNGHICISCAQNKPPLARVWASLRYRAPIPTMLHNWKHLRQSHMQLALWEIMRCNPPPWIKKAKLDSVLGMPISRERRLLRGFNQSDELAQLIAQEFNLHWLNHETLFRHHRAAQSSLNKADRHTNIKHAFNINIDVSNKRILLIDDVLTTGSSLFELARTLRKKGAWVVAWVMARHSLYS